MKLFFVARRLEEVVGKPLSSEWHGGVLVVAKNKGEALRLAQQYDDIDFNKYGEEHVWDVPIGVKGVIYDDKER